jgi:hypothetical protein
MRRFLYGPARKMEKEKGGLETRKAMHYAVASVETIKASQ